MPLLFSSHRSEPGAATKHLVAPSMASHQPLPLGRDLKGNRAAQDTGKAMPTMSGYLHYSEKHFIWLLLRVKRSHWEFGQALGVAVKVMLLRNGWV